MDQTPKLYRQFVEVASRNGVCIAMIARERYITYFGVLKAVESCAAAMAERGMRRGHTAILSFGRPEHYYFALLAASKLGIDVVVAGLSAAPDLGIPLHFAVVDEDVPIEKRYGALVLDQSWLTEREKKGPAVSVVEASMRLIVGTSGSTGRQKFVAHAEHEFLRQVFLRQGFVGSEAIRLFSTIPTQVSYALRYMVAVLLTGDVAVLIPFNPDVALAIGVFGVNAILTTPVDLENLLSLRLPRNAFASMRQIRVGGAAPSPDLLRRAQQEICDNITVSYGNAELGPIANCQYDPRLYRFGKIGKTVPGVEMKVMGDDGQALRDNEIGRLLVRRVGSETKVAYLNAPDSKMTGDDWFTLGDQGWVDENGDFYIAGRDGRVVNAGGNKFDLDLVEASVETFGLCQCAVVRSPIPRRDASVVVLVKESKREAAQVASWIRSQFLGLVVEAIYAVDKIAATETGKKDRVAMAHLLESEPESLMPLWPDALVRHWAVVGRVNAGERSSTVPRP